MGMGIVDRLSEGLEESLCSRMLQDSFAANEEYISQNIDSFKADIYDYGMAIVYSMHHDEVFLDVDVVDFSPGVIHFAIRFGDYDNTFHEKKTFDLTSEEEFDHFVEEFELYMVKLREIVSSN